MGKGYNSGKDDTYTVVILGDQEAGGNLNECIIIRCTNKKAVAECTGLKYNRIDYLFREKGLKYVNEGGNLILRTNIVYKGRQPGGKRNKGFMRRTDNSY